MVKTPKAPNPQQSQENTVESELPRNHDEDTRLNEAVQMVVKNTGQLVNDVPALVAENRDQLRTEAVQEGYLGEVKLDTLTLEQLDHANTLSRALGVESDVNNEDLMKAAKARSEKLRGKTRDTSKDKIIESIPANWRINQLKDGTIEAVNIVTHREYTGPAKDLFKTADAE